MKRCLILFLVCLMLFPVQTFALGSLKTQMQSLTATSTEIRLTPKTGVSGTLMVAGYQADGKLLSCQVRQVAGAAVTVQRPTADSIAIFFLSPNGCPLCNKFLWDGTDFPEKGELPEREV